MKKCSYCGRENPDDAPNCSGCGLDEFEPQPGAQTQEAEPPDNLVLLTTCGKLFEADLIVSKLQAAGIEAFIPDESLMQNVGFNLNTYGYVRVQVREQDLAAAKELLSNAENTVNDLPPAPSELDGRKVILSTEARPGRDFGTPGKSRSSRFGTHHHPGKRHGLERNPG